MKIALFATFVCLAAALPKGPEIEQLNHPGRIPGEYLVVLHAPSGKTPNNVYARKVVSKIATISSQISVISMFTNLRHPILHLKTTDDSVMTQLLQLAEVKAVTVNAEEQMIEQCSSQDTGSTLWGLSRLSSRNLPSFPTAQYSFRSTDGSGVRAFVLDTSIRITHNDFGGRAEFGANFAGGGNSDQNGHGTHCAGTVGGSTYGVSKGVTPIAVKVLGDSGSGQWAWSIAGLDYVVGQCSSTTERRCVASMSLGGGGNEGVDNAVNDADAAGVPVVVSAGNSNGDACNQSPARATGAITVGSTTITDARSSFSNYGNCMNILAPGSNILSAWWTSDSATNTISGTSMACPHVAGWVANYLAANPGATTTQVKAALSEQSTKDVVTGLPSGPNELLYYDCS